MFRSILSNVRKSVRMKNSKHVEKSNDVKKSINAQQPTKKYYTYEPLEHEHILRLLRIDSVDKDILHCALGHRHGDLGDEALEARYCALSYC